MIRLLFATNNQHKVDEINQAVGGFLRAEGLKEAGIDIDIPEPHSTLEENAAEKSTTVFRLTGIDCCAEDSGLEIESLNGAPGVQSARYAGPGKSSSDNIDKVLQEMRDMKNRKARFRTVISLIWKGQQHFFEGICEGEITPDIRGRQGFGYDPIFQPNGSDRTFGEMTGIEKNVYSHRKKAAVQLVSFLQHQGELPA